MQKLIFCLIVIIINGNNENFINFKNLNNNN
jgi:hypothetical protein